MASLTESLTTAGTLTCGTLAIPTSYSGSWPRAALTQDDLAKYDLPLQLFRTDEATPAMVGTAASSKLGLVRGSVGTDSLRLQTIDSKSNGGATAHYALTTFRLPEEYVAAETVQIVLNCKMVTTVADTTATIDVEAYPDDGDGTVSADICSTGATTINSLTAAAKTFTLNAGSLVAGSKLQIRINLTINDAAGATAVIGQVNDCYVLADIKG